MSIFNKQIEDAGKSVSAAASPPTTGSGKGAFWTKTIGGIVEGMYVDSTGQQIQLTNNGTINAAGSGEVNTASNVGTTGLGVFKQKVGVDLQFKKILAGSNVTLSNPDANTIQIDAAGGASAPEFKFVLPAASTLALRIPSATGLPANWTLATADTAGEGNFGSNVDTLVITWDPALGTKLAQEITVFQKSISGPAATQGFQKFSLSAAAEQKTNTAQTKGAAFLSGKGVDPAKDLIVFIKLI